MKLILGLGNPESRYVGTRHNVGFWALDQLTADADAEFKPARKFKAHIAELSLDGHKVVLIKPTTYYNEVGESARALLDFYKLAPSDLLVVHDDLALPLGTIRTRTGGSSGGNNGLKSLERHIGPNTARLRIGVWTERHHGADKVGIVLGKLSAAEQAILDAQRPHMAEIIHQFARDAFVPTTHKPEAL